MKAILDKIDTDALMILVPEFIAKLNAVVPPHRGKITSKMSIDKDESVVVITVKHLHDDSEGEILIQARQFNENDDDLWTLEVHDAIYPYVDHRNQLQFPEALQTSFLHF